MLWFLTRCVFFMAVLSPWSRRAHSPPPILHLFLNPAGYSRLFFLATEVNSIKEIGSICVEVFRFLRVVYRKRVQPTRPLAPEHQGR